MVESESIGERDSEARIEQSIVVGGNVVWGWVAWVEGKDTRVSTILLMGGKDSFWEDGVVTA
jgi:hypothetical protein